MTGRQAILVKSGGAALVVGALAFGVWQLGHAAYIHAKAELAQILLDRAWAQTLETGAAQKAWPWADTWPVARLEIPKVGASVIILDGASGEAMAFGPGHLHGTPAPGQPGTAIFSAHRDTHFAVLKELNPGDPLHVTGRDGITRTFTVTGARIVDASASGIDPWAGPPQLALVTCYPFEAVERGTQRYVVFAGLTKP